MQPGEKGERGPWEHLPDGAVQDEWRQHQEAVQVPADEAQKEEAARQAASVGQVREAEEVCSYQSVKSITAMRTSSILHFFFIIAS